MRILPIATLAAALLGAAAPALAQADNLGFEMGTLHGWTQHGGSAGATAAPWDPPHGSSAPFVAQEGDFYGYVKAGEDQNYATLSRSFNLTAGGEISGLAGFANFDGYDAQLDHFFNDKGYLAINGVKLLEWDGLTVGGFNNSGWDPFDFIADVAGVYTLEIGVANGNEVGGDGNLPSAVVLDAVQVTGAAAVPEPAAWAMMVMGFGLAGTALRTRRRTLSFG